MLYPFLALIATVGTTALLCCGVRYWGHQILGPILAGSVVTSIFIAGKLGTLELPGLAPLAITVSILIYSSTFLITDVISELAGAKAAHGMVARTARRLSEATRCTPSRRSLTQPRGRLRMCLSVSSLLAGRRSRPT